MAPSRRDPATLRRLATMRRWIVDGVPPADAVRQAVAKWRVSERQARRWRTEVVDQLTLEGRDPRTPTPEPDAGPGLVGVPPLPQGDALAQAEWLMTAMITETERALRDTTLPPLSRLDQLRKTARAVASLLPPERMYDAEQRVRRHAEGLDQSDSEELIEDAGSLEAGPGDDRPEGTGGSFDGPIRLSAD